MPRSREGSSAGPSAVEIERSLPASLQNSRKASQSKLSLPKSNAPRIPIPPATTPVTFPADTPKPDTLSPSQQRPAVSGSGSSSMLSSRRALSSPSPPSTLSTIPRSPLVIPGQSAGGLASPPVFSKVSSSLARNCSVPASLSHNTRAANLPTRCTSVSHSRPSLSSPSPPTPIVPSIPLRHATQHSPAQPTPPAVGNIVSSSPYTPHSAPTTYSRISIDRQQPSKKLFTEYSPSAASFATASDPNLPAGSASPTPVIPSELSQYALPLKHLLSKPASPSNFHSGSESEGASQPHFGFHQRSASMSDSVQYATSLRDSDISTIEFSPIQPFPPHSSTAARKQDRKDEYHYRHTTSVGASKVRQYETQGQANDLEYLSNWERDATGSARNRGKDKIVESRPRNVLKRRRSTSKFPDTHGPTFSDTPRLSRSFSASSLLKRSGLLSARSPTVRASPLSGLLPSPEHLLSGVSGSSMVVNSGDLHDRGNLTTSSQDSHVENISAPLQHSDAMVDGAGHMDKTHDIATRFISTISSAPLQTFKQPSSSVTLATSASLSPVHVDQPMSPGLATISSGASSKSRQSRDKRLSRLSPAGAVADAYKREQLAKETTKRYSTPDRSRRSTSPRLPPSIGDPDHPLVSPKLVVNPNPTSKGGPSPKRSSVSVLSPTPVSIGTADVTGKPSVAARETRGAAGGSRPLVSETGDNPVVKEATERFPSVTSPRPSGTLYLPRRSSSSSPLASPLSQGSNNVTRRNRLRKIRRTSDQSDISATPYYTVIGTRSDQVFGVGGPRDSFGENYTKLDESSWQVRTTITAGSAAAGSEKDTEKFGRSLSRKLSGKFRKNRSGGGSDENVDTPRGRLTWKDEHAPPKQARPSLSKDSPEKKVLDDKCMPYIYSMKKQAQSETDLSGKEKAAPGLPRFWRLFGRSKSRERSEDRKMGDPPPLPTLPKHSTPLSNDICAPVNSRRDRQGHSPYAHKSSRSKSNGPPSGRPSTGTRSSTSEVPSPSLWQSARSSSSSLDDIPPLPNPLPNLTRYATADADYRPQKPQVPRIASPPQNIHADLEEERLRTGNVTERSDSPPIPLFSTADVINSFPPRRSFDPPKNSPTSSNIPSPTSPPPRPPRSTQRPKLVHPNPTSFGDEALYPSVMKGSTRSIPKMTFREMHSEKRPYLTEREKADRWDALLQKSDAAGGTLHFGGDNDKLASDDLRFSRTLSELALDDD